MKRVMKNTTTTMPSITSALKRISDDKSLTLFNSIAISNGDKYIPLKEMNLTTKQYYSRVSGLLNTGLIKRHKGKYSLTLLGKVVYDAQMIIGKALTYYWKLKAIESIEMSTSGSSGLPSGELAQLVDVLIDNHKVKDILVKPIYVPSKNKSMVQAETLPMEQRIKA
jgi:hypothetical protein